MPFISADRQNFRQNNTAILILQKSARTMRGVLSLNLCVIKFLTKIFNCISDKGCSCPICQAEYEVSD